MRRPPGLAPKPVTSVRLAAAAGVATVRTTAAIRGTTASHRACRALRGVMGLAPCRGDAGPGRVIGAREVRVCAAATRARPGAPSAVGWAAHPGWTVVAPDR